MARFNSLTLVVVIILASISFSGAIRKFHTWQNVSKTGVNDMWRALDPTNVATSTTMNRTFGMIHGSNGKLWFISRRPSPWDESFATATQGGVVSTYDLESKSWTTHTAYGRPPTTDSSLDALFSLNGRLFMMTYSIERHQVSYQQLYSWHDDQWIQVPLRFRPRWTRYSYNNTNLLVKVSVPDPDGRKAYFSASSYPDHESERNKTACHVMIVELSIDFDDNNGNEPSIARMQFVKNQMKNSNSTLAMAYTPVHDQKLYTMAYYFRRDKPDYLRLDMSIDLENPNRTWSIFKGANPSAIVELEEERIFQAGSYALVIGPPRSDEKGVYRRVWSVDLESKQWVRRLPYFPQIDRPVFAFDQKQSVLYAAGAKEGIYSVKIEF